jgi:hypothetical protein
VGGFLGAFVLGLVHALLPVRLEHLWTPALGALLAVIILVAPGGLIGVARSVAGSQDRSRRPS